jgi:flagellar motor switch protein FliM
MYGFWSSFCMFPNQMATVHPLPAQPVVQPHPNSANSGNEPASNHALVTMPPQQPEEGNAIALNAPVARLPVELDVTVPVREFRVRNLLALEAGQVIESQWGNGEDVPLASGEVQLAWSEFEVIDTQLAVRITRLA